MVTTCTTRSVKAVNCVVLVFGIRLLMPTLSTEALGVLQCKEKSYGSVQFCNTSHLIRIVEAFIYDANGTTDEKPCSYEPDDCKIRLREVKEEEYTNLIDLCDNRETCNYTVPKLLIRSCGYTNYMILDYQCIEPSIHELTQTYSLGTRPQLSTDVLIDFVSVGYSDNDDSKNDSGLYIGLSVGSFALVTLVVICLILYKRRIAWKQRASERAEYAVVRTRNSYNTSADHALDTEILENPHYAAHEPKANSAHFSLANQLEEVGDSLDLVENPFYDGYPFYEGVSNVNSDSDVCGR